MIQQIKIENYKSITSLDMGLGRVNVLIGENGSGKTNILEALAVRAAAESGKLDYEYLAPRGIRIASPELMKSGFIKPQGKDDTIQISFVNTSGEEKNMEIDASEFDWPSTPTQTKKYILRIKDLTPFLDEEISKLIKIGVKKKVEGDNIILQLPQNASLQKDAISFIEKIYKDLFKIDLGLFHLDKFLIFCPENTSLRRFDDEGQIRPLGVRGEGLFSHLADLARKEPQTFQRINDELKLIDWFDNFEIPSDLMFTEKRIRIRDRYLNEGIQYIDQRSSNEGFLFLLFYVTLFVSPHTPKFFAIDNIDNALNPKLCSALIELIVKLAKENDKQVIFTAHNPGLLDGLNLNDEDQRLFVISRNKLGHTKALRIENKPSTNGHEPVKLSEQFLRGYIGGLPKNF